MKKYVLIHNDEGDLSVSEAFNTLPEAQDAMKKDFKSYFINDVGWSEEEFVKVIETQDECTGSCFIGETSAWSRYTRSKDWQIQEIEI